MRFRFGDTGDLTAPSTDRLTVGDPRVVDFLAINSSGQYAARPRSDGRLFAARSWPG